MKVFKSRHYIFAMLASFLCLSALFVIVSFVLLSRANETRDRRLSSFAWAEARTLANLLSPAFTAAYSFGAFMERGDDPKDLDDYARHVMDKWPIISTIFIARNGSVSHAYPGDSIPSFFGTNLLGSQNLADYSKHEKENRTVSIDGPSQLPDGGKGFLIRYPVFLYTADGKESFWGLVAVSVHLERLLDLSGLRDLESKEFRWALSSIPLELADSAFLSPEQVKIVPLPGLFMHQVFASSLNGLPDRPAIAEVPLPNATWTFALSQEGGWAVKTKQFVYSILAMALAGIISYFIVAFVARARRAAFLANALSLEVAERKATEEKLRKSISEKELLLREIHHRVKNNLAVVESIVSLQAEEARDTHFEEVFNQLSKRVHSIALIHEKLYRGRDLDRISAQVYLQDLVYFIVDSIGTSFEAPEIFVEKIDITSKAALSIGLILTELYTNAVKYGSSGRTSVKLIRRGDRLELSVEDEGPPPPEDFNDRPGLGLRLVGALSGQLDGDWHMESGPPVRFVVDFPASSALA